MGARHREGGGEDKTEAVKSRPKTELAFIPICRVCVCAQCECATQVMFVSEKNTAENVEILETTEWFTEEKSIHIPEAHNGACRGSDGVAQK